MPSKKLWAYIARLEKIIKSTIESSPEISELVEKIQREGVEVSLNCIALFSDREGRSFAIPDAARAAIEAAAAKEKEKSVPKRRRRKSPPASGKKRPPAKGKKATPEFKVTDADREFLKQIGIKFD
jgi:hypothetical protein